MPDDNQAVTEPRNAVEAASDPSHGGAVAEGTIKAAMVRFQKAACKAADFTSDFASLMSDIDGGEDPPATFVDDMIDGIEGPTAKGLHSAADAVEALFDRLSSLVTRAMAAHG